MELSNLTQEGKCVQLGGLPCQKGGSYISLRYLLCHFVAFQPLKFAMNTWILPLTSAIWVQRKGEASILTTGSELENRKSSDDSR